MQETDGTGGYEAAEAASMEVAQSLPRIRTTNLDEEQSPAAGSGAANGPTNPKVHT